MASVTSNYALRYQEVGDSPNGAVGLQNLANDVDAALLAIDAKIATLNALAPAFVGSTTDEASFVNTSFAAGASPVGVAFTAPPSGQVVIHMSGIISQAINQQAVFLSCEVKTGSTVGSGTLVGGAANSDRGITAGRAVNSGAPVLMQAGRPVYYTGLTPGASYNVRMMHCVDGGSGSVFLRELLVVPML